MFLSRRLTGLPRAPTPRSLLYTRCTKASRYFMPTTALSQNVSKWVLSPAACSASRRVSICVDLPEPSTPEKVIKSGDPVAGDAMNRRTPYLGTAPGVFVPGGLEDVPRLRAKTVPAATPAAATAPNLINRDRVRCCLAGAMATP